MSQGCFTPSSSDEHLCACPESHTRGKPIQLMTLKSLLKPSALERLNPNSNYRFCDAPECSVVYFSSPEEMFTTEDVKVPVFQKDEGDDVPVCYCFGWTRQRLQNELAFSGQSTAIESITAHVHAKRCGCEVNNPQGTCCLGNVKRVLQQQK
ncbi:MAG: putative iron-sulfur cluster-binding metallochaperone [Elainellaceae cyanobacterium]